MFSTDRKSFKSRCPLNKAAFNDNVVNFAVFPNGILRARCILNTFSLDCFSNNVSSDIIVPLLF